MITLPLAFGAQETQNTSWLCSRRMVVWHGDEEAGERWGTSSIETRKSLPEANATTPGRYTYPASYSVIAFLSDSGIDSNEASME